MIEILGPISFDPAVGLASGAAFALGYYLLHLYRRRTSEKVERVLSGEDESGVLGYSTEYATSILLSTIVSAGVLGYQAAPQMRLSAILTGLIVTPVAMLVGTKLIQLISTRKQSSDDL